MAMTGKEIIEWVRASKNETKEIKAKVISNNRVYTYTLSPCFDTSTKDTLSLSIDD